MPAMPPVVHHVELCVSDAAKVLSSLHKFGFYHHARRVTSVCHQWAVKVGGCVFVVTERRSSWKKPEQNGTRPQEAWTTLCCENKESHEVDTVFNVALSVKNVEGVTRRIVANGGSVIQQPIKVSDNAGEVIYSIVRSCCGNVIHTLINKDNYHGIFLPGFESAEVNGDAQDKNIWDGLVTHVDHVTLATYPGDSQRIISWYEKCFGMRRFSINKDDDDDEGLILDGGVGLRLRAMEYWRCAETGLSYELESTDSERIHNGIMLVVVESLPGQRNCNVETFLKEHEQPGVEHIALSTQSMVETVSRMVEGGVNFRQPPASYYNHISKAYQIQSIGENITSLQKLGILLDSEVAPDNSDSNRPKYLMQIFAHPMFSRKTFFIEVIQRCGARGLGAGNILALVRCIREEEARKKENGLVQMEKSALQEKC